jgi:apolipoprotein N-acyltransferase
MTSAAVAGAASISERIEARPVWQIQLGAMAAGAVATLGHAPFFFTPAYVAGLVALIFLLDGAMRRPKPASAAFARAWSFAFGHFLTGMYWVGFAFLQVEGAAPFIPLAVSALPAGLALFWGAAGALSTSLWTKDYRRIPVFAAVFGFAEFLRGFIFTGFPWQIPAAIWPAGGAVSQAASIVGATGLSVLTLLVLAAPAAGADRTSSLRRFGPVLLAALALGLTWGAGSRRLEANPERAVGPVVRVLDPGLSQEQKWSLDPADVLIRYLDLTGPARDAPAEVVIWPEGAVPPTYFVGDDAPRSMLDRADMMAEIGRVLQDRVLIAGTVRAERGKDGLKQYNSAVVIDGVSGEPRISQISNKHHLVPFGEYMPFWELYSSVPIAPLQMVGQGFTPGVPPERLVVPGAPPATVLICYEGIFPRLSPRGPERPDWLVNISIDGWYGRQTGPWQHVNLVKYRAIEEGLPLARAASGGVSGIFDAYGRTIVATKLDGGAVEAPLPETLPPTFFARFGAVSTPILLILVLALRFGLPRTPGRGFRS